jgi:type IV pilus assembly protein PilB
MVFIYWVGIKLYGCVVWVASFFHIKARQWVSGRKKWKQNLKTVFFTHKTPVAWFHCASLGEFEQGRPLIEQFRHTFPEYTILLTFFSLFLTSFSSFAISAEAMHVLPEKLAREKNAVCFFYDTEQMRIGALEPSEEVTALLKDLKAHHHAEIKLYLISEHSLEHVFKLFANLPIIKPISKDIIITDEELAKYGIGIENLASLQAQFKDVSITDILTLMVASALKVNSSDIHVEAEEKGIAVRYRIDGVLHDVATLPKEQWKRFISRIKLLAALKINVTDRPQDGRVTLQLSSGSLDIRVSTIPTTYGESVVMRLATSGSSFFAPSVGQ